jgi:hypothetical protein
MTIYKNPVSHKETLRKKAKSLGFQVHITACSARVPCSVYGSWHVALRGNGLYRNNLSLDQADDLIAEWVAQDARKERE